MFVTEIRNIPYFDGHCDTIYECMGTGRSMRENSGHVDLMRGQRYGRRAQFFALFDNVRELPEGTAWTKLCQMHDWFCAQAAENADVMALCRTGAEVDAAAAQHKTAALLSIEGADLLDCDMAHLETAASWGVRLLNPVWNNANALCLGGRVVGPGLACQIVDAFLDHEFEGGRHQKRINKMMALETL